MKSNNKKGQSMIKKERQTHQDIKIDKEYNSLNQESNITKEIMKLDRRKTQ